MHIPKFRVGTYTVGVSSIENATVGLSSLEIFSVGISSMYVTGGFNPNFDYVAYQHLMNNYPYMGVVSFTQPLSNVFPTQGTVLTPHGVSTGAGQEANRFFKGCQVKSRLRRRLRTTQSDLSL
ncbi:hypothetical protein PIB30_060161, partial [Stylosanthes scabra]|nr:hypothetical protein [Stylosanthes scabra]